MQHDEVIWQIIRHNHCSYMSKIETGIFCRNPYNVTGVCNRSSCPLANSRYATIRDHDGVFYLYMKTIERAHMPDKLWERVKLPRNYLKAMEIIDKHMMFWPKLLVHKMKQRLTKMTQMRIRMRKLALKTREKVVPMPRKQVKRDARRLEKAEKAAMLDKKIEDEILERLQRGVYDGIYNYNQKSWNQYLEEHELEHELEQELEDELEEEHDTEFVSADDMDEIEDMEDFGKFSTASADHSKGAIGSDEDDEDVEEASRKSSRRVSGLTSKGKKKATVLLEVEHEGANDRRRKKAVQ